MPNPTRSLAIDASGAAGPAVGHDLYQDLDAIPWRGPLAANTVAGVVSGWDLHSAWPNMWGKALPLSRLFEDAIHYAEQGFALSAGQAERPPRNSTNSSTSPGFADQFLSEGGPAPAEGLRCVAGSWRHPPPPRQARPGDFYRGETAR